MTIMATTTTTITITTTILTNNYSTKQAQQLPQQLHPKQQQ